ncbi:uncharacterized protein Dwil_GK19023 [Drosophila willistoni]|uniref:SLC41A/MgtE integral membrane domain-containing protein n=1 Tax=Drosophila willistoni TaxID=7260 RepID=B4MWQ7_DROWI|nr:solute carrier family 41 member 1-like [Drosophila willistoni]EDW76546.2 uncharacterized protein Dwil_GK19023 [Drosophila willistoni]
MASPKIKLDPAAPTTSTPEGDVAATYSETWYSTLIQIVIPFCLASTGTIVAGILLGNVQDWRVFKEMSELIVLVPALCGLKGNLDMCLASRLTTHSKLGQLGNFRDIRQIVIANMALVQAQAIVSSVMIVIMTVVMGSAVALTLMFGNFSTLAAAALITSTVSSTILDSLLMGVILFSQRYHFNPDYLATPIVASIGDVVSISLLSLSAAILYDLSATHVWISLIIMFCYLFLFLPFWITLILNNIYTRQALKYAWIPLAAALFINEIGGYVLSSAVVQFKGFAVFSPIINGICGNLVCVQASNMGSIMHHRSELGTFPEGSRICESPWRVLLVGTIYSRVARILICISIPANALLVYVADYFYKSYISVNVIFVASFVLTSLLQLLILLWTAHVLIHLLWRWKIDPDSSAIPYLTALGDCVGTSFLSIMFHLLRLSNQEYQPKTMPWIRLDYDTVRFLKP